MRGKIWLVIAVLVLGVTVLGAQGPAGSSFGLSNSGICNAPALGYFGFCKPTAGGPVQFTDDGSAYKAANLSGGAIGPQGISGVAGPAGPQGIPGASGALPATFSCSSMMVTATGVALSGCK